MNIVPNGDLGTIKTWVLKAMVAYLIRVARTHNLPSLEALATCMTIEGIRASPSRQVWLHWLARFGGTMTQPTDLFKFD